MTVYLLQYGGQALQLSPMQRLWKLDAPVIVLLAHHRDRHRHRHHQQQQHHYHRQSTQCDTSLSAQLLSSADCENIKFS